MECEKAKKNKLKKVQLKIAGSLIIWDTYKIIYLKLYNA